MLGAIAYVAYRKAKRRNRVTRQNSPATDATMWFLGAVLVFWPVALAYALHESLSLEKKKKYWVMSCNVCKGDGGDCQECSGHGSKAYFVD